MKIKVAAYQAPLLPSGSTVALDLIQEQIEHCAQEGVEVLCCPESILGGLADNSLEPLSIALSLGIVNEIYLDSPEWDIPLSKARPWRRSARKGEIYKKLRGAQNET